MGFEHILVERSGDFATVTMNRPQRRNALSLAHMRELITAFRETSDALIPIVTEAVRAGDIVLVKGSNGSRMSRVVDALSRLAARP